MLTNDEKAAFVRDGYLVKKLDIPAEDIQRAVDLTWSFTPPSFDRALPETWTGMVEDSCHAKTISQRRGRVKYRECVRKEKWLVDMIFDNAEVLSVVDDLLGAGLAGPRQYIRGLYPNFPSPTTKKRGHQGHMDHHPFQLGVNIYLSEIEQDGGGFVVWPGSHKVMRNAFAGKASVEKGPQLQSMMEKCEAEIAPIELTGGPGTAVFWHHRLLHAASTNYTRSVRHALLGDFLRHDFEARADEPQGADMWSEWAVGEERIVSAA
ncbi:MAG: phytanoyl-CoA dioxygenase family protein [Neomegalonema sp.]|nr:phytanoyl-CoA dioxygenase family protein [Neomegalonema sp.]